MAQTEKTGKLAEFSELGYIFSRLEFKKLPFYNLFYGSPLTGDKGIGDYRLTPAGTIERNKEKKSGYPYMFAGISIVNRRVFDNETRARFSLRDCFDAAEKSGRLGFVVNEAEFFHVGTPQALKEAEAKIHRQKQKKC